MLCVHQHAYNNTWQMDEAQSTTALLFFLVQLDESRCGMVYAAVGDVELYCYSHHKGGWMSLMQPFGDLRFKEISHKHQVEGGIGNGFGHVRNMPMCVI